jgi:L-lactate permease
VVVGTCTVGMVGKEGEVMRHLLIYIIFQVSLISVMTVIGVLFK